MVKISNTSYENEIHRVGGFQNINVFARDALISEEGRPENLGKMAKNRETYCYVN